MSLTSVGGLPVGAGVAQEDPSCNVTIAVIAPDDYCMSHNHVCVCVHTCMRVCV